MSGRTVPVGDVGRDLVVGRSARADAAASALADAVSGREPLTAATTADALDRLDEEAVRCVVVEFDRIDADDLGTIRAADTDRPIVAIAEREAASAALEAGATDVVRPDELEAVLAARVANATRSDADRETRYRAVLAASRALVVVLDEAGEPRYVSPAIEAETGYTPDDVERRGLGGLVHPDDRETVSEALADVAASELGATVAERVRVGHADGTWHLYDVALTNRLADPAVDGIVATVERGRVESPRDAVADAFSYPVLSLDPDGAIAYANEAARDVLGRGAVRGTVVWELLPEPFAGRLYERVREAIATGEPVAIDPGAADADGSLAGHVHPAGDGVAVSLFPAAGERDELGDVLEALPDGLLVLEGERIVRANAAAFELLDADALAGRPLADVLPDGLADRIRRRTGSTVVRRTDPVEARLDGSPVSIRVVPVRATGDDERFVCLLRDVAARERTERALAALRTVREDVLAAETRLDVCRGFARAAVDAVDPELVAVYLADGDRLRPAVVEGGDLDPGDLSALEAGAFEDEAVLEGPELGDPFGGAVRADRALVVPLGEEGVALAAATGPISRADRTVGDLLGAVGTLAFRALDRAREIRRLDRELSRSRERSDRAEALLGALRSIDRRLAAATDREGVERAVVDELATVDGVAFAWIGDADATSDGVVPRVLAGEDDGYLDAIDVDPEGEPLGRTIATGDVRVVEDVVDEDRTGRWRREALDRGFRSAVAVPVTDGDYVYGGLAIYGEHPSAFDDATVVGLEAAGARLGLALSAHETRRALLADAVTELELAVRDAPDPLVAVADRGGWRIDVESVVPRSDGRSTVFATVVDADPDAVERAVADREDLEAVRRIGDPDDGTRVELESDGRLLAETVADRGGRVTAIDAAASDPVLAVELPRDADVRSFVDALGDTGASIELVARRARERPARSSRAFRDRLEERLSERQRRALEAAYTGGFFEWPRESTGEEIARSLGVSQPTFSRHLRAGQRKLFALLFDEE